MTGCVHADVRSLAEAVHPLRVRHYLWNEQAHGGGAWFTFQDLVRFFGLDVVSSDGQIVVLLAASAWHAAEPERASSSCTRGFLVVVFVVVFCRPVYPHFLSKIKGIVWAGGVVWDQNGRIRMVVAKMSLYIFEQVGTHMPPN